jgi:hypothetical protein
LKLIAITFQERAVARLAILTLFMGQARECLHPLI